MKRSGRPRPQAHLWSKARAKRPSKDKVNKVSIHTATAEVAEKATTTMHQFTCSAAAPGSSSSSIHGQEAVDHGQAPAPQAATAAIGPVAKKMLKLPTSLQVFSTSASKVTMATSPLVLGLSATLKDCKKPGLKEKLAPEAIKALEQGLKDAREAKAAWQAVMLRLANPPTSAHLQEKHIREQCKSWRQMVHNAQVMIQMANIRQHLHNA